jgi:IclR family acetate operon transcriptional repressor
MRTLDILELVVAQGRAMAAHEIATALAIPVSSLSYLLTTLVDRGYLKREGRRYSGGAGLARLHVRELAQSLAERVAPLVRTMRVQLNETATFFVLKDYMIEALVTEIGHHALRYAVEVGRRAPLHAFSSGKALLATFDAAELDRYFATATLERFTPHTITTEAELRQELDRIRRTGIATAREEYTIGICGISRVLTIGGEVMGALSVAIPLPRYSDQVEQKAVNLLTRAVNLIADDGDEAPRNAAKG